MEDKVILSVCMITYNQEKYIKDAIQSVLSQEINFKIEFIIANDCSTDTTDDIICEIIEQHPKGHLITYVKQKNNLGMMPNFAFALQQCQGDFIALCEGDDYWTDPLKLQKQVDFLEKHSDFVVCSHNVEELNMFNDQINIIPGNKELIIYNLDNYIINNKTATCSMLFKREAMGSVLPQWFYEVSFGDWALVLIILKNSEKLCAVLPDTMGVYRIHIDGIHSNLYQNKKTFRNAFKQHISFIKTIRKELLNEKKHTPLITKKLMKAHTRLYLLNLECKNFVMAIIHKIISLFYRLKYNLIIKKNKDLF